ncbi:MAG: hypothetical protein ACPGQL_10910 [Thermoplasmatota archaeon]
MKTPILAAIVVASLMTAALTGIALSFAFADDDGTSGLASGTAHSHGDHASQTDAVPEFAPPGADEAAHEGGMAGDHDHSAVGMERPAFPPATGTVPTASAAQSLEQVSRIIIRGDDGATPDAGIRTGSGTIDDPFVIDGYYVTGDLFIADTDACFIVKENYIGGQLTLNWNGQCVHAHHNYVRDLRVNENVARDGYATGGLIELNKIEYIGQLRHYDGEFRDNIVGPRAPNSMWDEVLETVPWMFGVDPRVANIDGFNQGLIHHNTFHGSVDLDFHGHHHGTGFYAPHSHYHGDDMERGMMHDHTERWTSVFFTDNKIVDPDGYGLRYEDRGHAGDDRLANSEQEETLDDAHRHYTRAVIARNVIEGGPLTIDVFNADDDLHYDRNPGWVELTDNKVHLIEREEDDLLGLDLPWFGGEIPADSALRVFATKEAEISIIGNELSFQALPDQGSDPLDPVNDLTGMFFGPRDLEPAAIDLIRIADADIQVRDNTATGFTYGVRATQFDELVDWIVSGNDFGAASHPVYYDESVANRPTED